MNISMVFLLGLLLLVLIIGLVVAAASKNAVSEGGNNVLKNVYIYLVLFATLMMTIGGSVAAFMAAADIIAPAPYHQSYEEYRQWGIEKTNPNGQPVNNLSETEIKARYDAMVAAEKDRQMNRAQNNLVKSLGWIIIPLPVFLYYQKRLGDNKPTN